MVFYMPGKMEEGPLGGVASQGDDAMTAREVVTELDRFIVRQDKAKRAVAIALRNRWRRRRLPDHIADEVFPKNILMIGPTGVGKTEIARRLARLTRSPFLKVEATKYTEIGYVGRDCESMIRDLVELAIGMVRQEKSRAVAQAASRAVENRLLDALARRQATGGANDSARGRLTAREEMRRRLREGELESEEVEIDVTDPTPSAFKIAGGPGMEEIDVKLGDMMPGMFAKRSSRRKMTVAAARDVLQTEEEERRLAGENLEREAIRRVEQSGIIFLDELDKVAGGGTSQGPDVSRQGVQRDLLPIVEGTIVQTKHGSVRTDHVLFIAAGAFHICKPSDLIPELQGRFPIRVELERLVKSDLVRILSEPENSLIKQYCALLDVDGVKLTVTNEAIEEIAALADAVNRQTEDIGARRLSTILERLLEPVLFDAPGDASGPVEIGVDAVRALALEINERQDLARFML